MADRLAVSRRLAYVLGVLAPAAETVRRWGTWWNDPPAYLDDLLLGALLITGAWAARSRSGSGRGLLAAAWGFACGMAYFSIAMHFQLMRAGEIDPAPIPTQGVFAIKIVGGLVCVLGLALAVADRNREERSET